MDRSAEQLPLTEEAFLPGPRRAARTDGSRDERLGPRCLASIWGRDRPMPMDERNSSGRNEQPLPDCPERFPLRPLRPDVRLACIVSPQVEATTTIQSARPRCVALRAPGCVLSPYVYRLVGTFERSRGEDAKLRLAGELPQAPGMPLRGGGCTSRRLKPAHGAPGSLILRENDEREACEVRAGLGRVQRSAPVVLARALVIRPSLAC